MMFKKMIAGALLGASYLPVTANELDESNLYRGPSSTLYKYDLSNPSDQRCAISAATRDAGNAAKSSRKPPVLRSHLADPICEPQRIGVDMLSFVC